MTINNIVNKTRNEENENNYYSTRLTLNLLLSVPKSEIYNNSLHKVEVKIHVSSNQMIKISTNIIILLHKTHGVSTAAPPGSVYT